MKTNHKFSVTLRSLAVAGILFSLGACASGGGGKIVLDRSGDFDPELYRKDLEECEQYAKEISIKNRSAVRAGSNAAVGAVVGAIFGGAAQGAATGAATGGASGAIDARSERVRIVKNCLIERDYTVLN